MAAPRVNPSGDDFVKIDVSIEVFPARINQMTDTANGPVGLHVKNAANLVHAESQRLIGTRYSGHHAGPRLKDSGKVVSIGGANYAVVYDHPIALLHHNGAAEHFIPLGAKGVLYRKGPGVVDKSNNSIFGNRMRPPHGVAHPGSPANPYLVTAAQRVGLQPSGTLLRGDRPAQIFRLRPTT